MVYSRGKSAVPDHRGRGIRVLVVVLGVVALIAITALVLSSLGLAPFGLDGRETELVALWNAGDYDRVAELSAEMLESDPLNGEALTFAGFASFYGGIEDVLESERTSALEASVVYLRRARIAPNSPFPAERDYVLGKAYFHRGDPYMDLAVFHLERALEAGHLSADARVYLGLGYAELGDYTASVARFEEAVTDAAQRADEDSVNEIRLQLAESYTAAGEYESAEATLEEAIRTLGDDYLELLALNRLASLLILEERLDEAAALLESTIDRYPESADAFFYLGVVYDERDETVLARDFWRRAREIDPNHEDALRRLANREG